MLIHVSRTLNGFMHDSSFLCCLSLCSDHRGTQIYLGINHTGISTFASGKRVQHFRWPEVHKLNYEGKMFIAHLSYMDREAPREPVSHFRWLKTRKKIDV